MTSDPGPDSGDIPSSPPDKTTNDPPGSGPLAKPDRAAKPTYGPPTYGPAPYPPLPAPYGRPSGHALYPYAAMPHVHARMRASTADRDRTVDVLKAAYSEGRLTKDEFDARSGRVLAARTYAELGAIVADLPAGPGGPAFQGGYYPAVVPGTPTSGLAIGAMACGFAEILSLGFLPAIFLSIPTVILGHMAKAQIRQTGEQGEAMAIVGLVLGYLGIAAALLIVVSLSQ